LIASIVDSIAIFGISSISIFRIKKDMVSLPFGIIGTRNISVPGRIVTLSTKTGLLGHWKRDLAI
jgi:hypothetical protein